MVGADHDRRPGYRNHYCPAASCVASMQRLEAAGLAVKGRQYGDDYTYHATEAGCKAAGLDEAGVKRCLEDAP
jgi:hypothetical protein